MRVFIVRHGETGQLFDEARCSFYGLDQDPSLNSKGIDECRRCSLYLTHLLQGKGFDAVYYSSAKRTTQTMELLLMGRPAPRLVERSDFLLRGQSPENLQEFVTTTFQSIQDYNLRNILIVSHGATTKDMLLWLSDIGQLEHTFTKIETPRTASVTEIQNSGHKTFALQIFDSLP